MDAIDPLALAVPLSSFVLARLPSHPLPHLVLDPVLARLAAVEAFVLLSTPSIALERLGVARSTIVGILSCALVAVLTRWRRQWRTFVMLCGVGEAVGRTLALVDRADRATTSTQTALRPTLDDSADGDGADIDGTTLTSEAQHLLSFWTLFFSLSLFETLRTAPSKSSLLPKSRVSTRLRNSLRSLRYTYLRFLRLWIVPLAYRSRYAYLSLIQSHPRFDLSSRAPRFPSVPFAARFAHLLSPASYIARPASSFPQPLPAASDLSAFATLPFAHSYFSSRNASQLTGEVRWNVIKTLILWTGLRRDAFGAKSVLFDWILGPIVRNWRNPRNSRSRGVRQGRGDVHGQTASGPEQTEGISPRLAVRVRPATDLEDEPALPAATAATAATAPSARSHSPPRPPPIWTTLTPPRSAANRTAALRYLDAMAPTSTSSPEFSTPHAVLPHRVGIAVAHSSMSPDSSSTDRPKSDRDTRRRQRRRGRDSLLLESPPRLLGAAVNGGDGDESGSGSASDASTEDAHGDEAREKETESPPRTEAEEGIQRWATVPSLHSPVGQDHPVKGLESVGRGWSI